MNNTQSSTVDEKHSDAGAACAVFAVVLGVIGVLPILSMLTSTSVAQDFEQGTHTADYAGLTAATWLFGMSTICAAVAAIGATGKSQTTGVIVAMLSGLGLLSLLIY